MCTLGSALGRGVLERKGHAGHGGWAVKGFTEGPEMGGRPLGKERCLAHWEGDPAPVDLDTRTDWSRA